MKNKFEIFLDTDILKSNLIPGKNKNFVPVCLGKFECFTSVINAAEIFESCKTAAGTEKAKKSFAGINILGIPFRYSVKISEILKKVKRRKLRISLRDALIMSMCIETKLPLLAENEKKYSKYRGILSLKLINKDLILENNSAEEIFRKAKIFKK